MLSFSTNKQPNIKVVQEIKKKICFHIKRTYSYFFSLQSMATKESQSPWSMVAIQPQPHPCTQETLELATLCPYPDQVDMNMVLSLEYTIKEEDINQEPHCILKSLEMCKRTFHLINSIFFVCRKQDHISLFKYIFKYISSSFDQHKIN